MLYRRVLPVAILVSLLGLGLAVRAGEAAIRLDAPTMKAALRTATPEEDGFIDRVVELMNETILPRKLVRSTFLWAKKKPKRKFQYFKQGLIFRAARRGIKVG